MNRHITVYMAVVFFMLTFGAEAATITRTFLNDQTTDAVYLFIVNDQDDPFIRFADEPVRFLLDADANGWQSMLFDDNTTLMMYGDAIDPRSGRFRVTFQDGLTGGGNGGFDFRLEWAEYFQGGVLDQGSLYYSNGGYTGLDNTFTSSVPTPVPASVWMMVSGLALLVGLSRCR